LVAGTVGLCGEPATPGEAKKAAVDAFGDPLPAGALARLGTLRFQHGSAVRMLRYSRDGKVLASLGADEVIRLWDTESGQELQAIHLHEHSCAAFAFSGDGKHLATSGSDNVVRLWDAKTGKVLHSIADDNDDRANAIAFSPDGKTLAINGSEVRLIDVATGKVTKRLEALQPVSFSNLQDELLVFSADGKTLLQTGATPDGVYALKFLPVAEGGRSATMRSYAGVQMFSPDLGTLASLYNGIQVYDLSGTELKEPRRIAVVAGDERSVARSPDGKLVAAVDRQGELGVWEVASGEAIKLDQPLKTPGNVIAFAPDGKHMAIAGQSMIRIVDFRKGTDVRPAPSHTGAIQQVAQSPDGKTLLTIGSDHVVCVWEASSGKVVRRIEGPAMQAPLASSGGCVVFAPDGKRFVVGWLGQSPRLYETGTGKEVRTLILEKEDAVGFVGVAFTADGKSVAGLRADGVVSFWDPLSGEVLRRFQVDAGVTAFTFSPDGKLMITLHEPQAGAPFVNVWELATNKQRHKIRADFDLGARPAMSPDGRFLVVTAGTSICRLDLSKGKKVYHISTADALLSPAVFSPDGKLLAAGDSDGKVHLWEAATGAVLGEFAGHRGPITSVLNGSNGKTLITAGADGTVLIWDVPFLRGFKASACVTLTRPQLDDLLKDVTGNDAEKAGKAIWALVDAPTEVLPLIKERLKPVPAPEEKRIARLVKDLGHDDFDTRVKASEELDKLGELAQPALEKCLQDQPELEVRKRIDELLEKLQKPITSPDLLGALRLIEVLEHIGTPEARKILEDVRHGATDSRVTREAKLALERLAQR
jgi:WD40 repeat protein